MQREIALLVDMVENARCVMDYVKGLEKQAFLSHLLVQDAVIRRLSVVGEAARFISKPTCALIPIPWHKVRAMRHILVHDYDDINLDVVWEVATVHAPDLVLKITAYLDESGCSPPPNS
jgi:uncharacterized protein with HEPN domain